VQAVRDAGAEVVIVSLHLRIEMQYGPLSDVRAFVEQLTAAVPVDAVIQHGPHVIQPVEEVNGTPVFWSIGNLLSGMGPPASGRYADPRTLDGLLASVRFTQTTPGRFTAVATPVLVCLDPSTRIVWPAAALGDPAAPTAVVQACIDRSRSVTG
jgi:poly-gamma-glutamate synthesis protein (capsule biosynthesis protein)